MEQNPNDSNYDFDCPQFVDFTDLQEDDDNADEWFGKITGSVILTLGLELTVPYNTVTVSNTSIIIILIPC